MVESSIQIGRRHIRLFAVNTVVVGSGASGFNAADRLASYGQNDICMVTEDVNAGTSRNTGSDKQTYYKLTLSGGDPDSVCEMAQTLFDGLCVDGDVALCEAALSAQSFLRLVELGVPFPRNRYGEYIGYKTDHDPRRRATSAGPYTSKYMTQCLEQAVNEKDIRIFDKMQVIRVLTHNGEALGLLCLDLNNLNYDEKRFIAFQCKNIIFATGGPAGMYADSVYPASQYGATGLAFEAGVIGKNLTEWQYGLASTNPRWNVSGTYMQVLPRFVSVDSEGADEREFLLDFFGNKEEMLNKVFLKGYQWPFDVRKILDGSSIIDVLVYIEKCKGRRVYLDFRSNPRNEGITYSLLSDEVRSYLENAGACFGTPYDRLLHMNRPAVDFYGDNGIDLGNELLEIALCAQHNNGGLSIDCWWHTNIKGFFAVGEACASHGVYRPGGSALNAGQVGSMRAAQFIAAHRRGQSLSGPEFVSGCIEQINQAIKLSESVQTDDRTDSVKDIWRLSTKRMSRFGACVRNRGEIEQAVAEVKDALRSFCDSVRITNTDALPLVFQLRDTLICQYVYLHAMLDYIKAGGKSRGSALYTDLMGTRPDERLPDMFTFKLEDDNHNSLIQETQYQNNTCSFTWRPVRPIPQDEDFFENIWRTFRTNGNVF